ncbi:MAG TPA: substrate-binding domain-containing protein, partial [Opitutales bacterium]|nr:substrate-binding domain-containing protein [Opitutales bacterium]
RGAHDMVAALVAMGHRRILHISGLRGLLGAERRVAGYRRALAEASLPTDPNLIVASNFSSADARIKTLAWLDHRGSGELPDAIFCGNDAAALGCMEALASRGIRVPADVSVCGFDDSIAARTTVPQLATVCQPLRAMGEKAVEVLMKRIESMHAGSVDSTLSPVVFDTTVVLRGSVAERPFTA